MNSIPVKVLSSQNLVHYTNIYRCNIYENPETSSESSGDIKEHVSNIRTICTKDGKYINICTADPDAEEILSTMEQINDRNEKELKTMFTNYAKAYNKLQEVQKKLDMIYAMNLFDRVKFVFGGIPCVKKRE